MKLLMGLWGPDMKQGGSAFCSYCRYCVTTTGNLPQNGVNIQKWPKRWIESLEGRTPWSSYAWKPHILVKWDNSSLLVSASLDQFSFTWNWKSWQIHFSVPKSATRTVCTKCYRSRREATANYVPRGVWTQSPGKASQRRGSHELDLEGWRKVHHVDKIEEAIPKLFKPVDEEIKKDTFFSFFFL